METILMSALSFSPACFGHKTRRGVSDIGCTVVQTHARAPDSREGFKAVTGSIFTLCRLSRCFMSRRSIVYERTRPVHVIARIISIFCCTYANSTSMFRIVKEEVEVPIHSVSLSRHWDFVTQTFQLRTHAVCHRIHTCSGVPNPPGVYFVHPCETANWRNFVRICRPPPSRRCCTA